MSNGQLFGRLAVMALVLAAVPSIAAAQPIGTCAVSVANDCSIESNLTTAPLDTDLCNDGVDNDGNGLVDSADPHCLAEVLCQDGVDNDGDNLVDQADVDCRCMDTAFGSATNCTANDILISYQAQANVSDGCINSSDTVVARLTAQLTSSSPNRYDIGMWIPLDGGSGDTGAHCTRDLLQPANPAAGITGPFPIPVSGIESFASVDSTRDACGDSPNSSVSTYEFPFNIEIPCTDILQLDGNGNTESAHDGFIDFDQCGSWHNNDGTLCNSSAQVLPQTKSKCRCERTDSDVPGPNLRMACDAFTAGGVGGTLDPTETASFTISYENDLVGTTCSATSVSSGDLGRGRCGTASFIQFVIDYGNADTYGSFFYSSPGDIQDCNLGTPLTISGVGILCDDTGADRLVWIPEDANATYSNYGVVSPFTGTRDLTFQFTRNTTNLAPGDTIAFVSQIYWSGSLNVGPSPTTVSQALDFTNSVLQDAPSLTDNTCSTNVQTTPITLSSFRATPAGRGVQFDWTTETEVGNVGFNLYAVVGGRRIALNGEPIPTTTLDSLEPQSYSAWFPVPDDASAFEIEDVDFRGRTRSHGPFRVGPRYGTSIAAPTIDWTAIRRDTAAPRRGRNAGPGGPASLSSQRTPQTGASTSSGAAIAIDLLVDVDGLYRVTYDDLLANGFDLSGQRAAQLSLSSQGQPVPLFVNAKNKFGPGSYIEFRGRALDTLYTHTNVYRLVSGDAHASHVVVDMEAPAGSESPTYLETREFERDRGYASSSAIADPFYDTRMLVFTTPNAWPFDFSIDGYQPAGGPAKLKAVVYGGTSLDGVAPDHHVEFYLNGSFVGESTFDGASAVNFETEVPAGLLTNGPNTLTLRLPGDTGAPFDVVAMDSFEVVYPRGFAASGDRLDFAAAGDLFRVTGFSSSDLVAYRKDASGTVRLQGLRSVSSASGFDAILPGSATLADYEVAAVSALLSPVAIRPARVPVGLDSGSAAYLVISHPAFLPGLAPLVAAREADGLTVKVVDVEDVYARYSGGILDPGAIRDYIAHAFASMGTRYVLLVGGDTYDYLDHLGLGAVSFVPSIYVQTSENIRFAPSDALYADVDGDGLQDLAIGRFPVRTLVELDNMVEKTLQYGSAAFGASGTFAADHADAAAHEPFRTASERIIGRLPFGWQVNRVYLDEHPLEEARAQLVADLNAGSRLTSYVGHSGLIGWGSPALPASQQLLSVNDVPNLGNSGKPTVVMQLGCWNAYYVSPLTESLGVRLTLEAERGAAAVMGAATLTEDENGSRLGALLAPRLAERGETIGDALMEARRELSAISRPDDDLRDVVLGWTLLGDPALRVNP